MEVSDAREEQGVSVEERRLATLDGRQVLHGYTHRERERERSHYIAESRIYQTVLLVLSKCNSVECTYTERSLLKQKNNRKFLGNKSVTERVQREREGERGVKEITFQERWCQASFG